MIIKIRAKTEGLSLAEETVAVLAQIGDSSSLRYAVQLLTPASIIARLHSRSEILKEDVEEASLLFFDAKTSAKVISQSDKFLL